MGVRTLDHFIGRYRVLSRRRDLRDSSDADLLRLFARDRDEAAFELLVQRYWPTVMGVSSRLLPCSQDAEDVFQATFLLLAQRAGSLRSPGTVGNWLYGVAYRTALEARAMAARRRVKEALASPRAE